MKSLVALLPVLIAFQAGAPPALAWTWPVDGPVLRPFALGDDPYAAGQHRGIDVGAAPGSPVLAPAAGTVTFAGTVPGGGRTVTVLTGDGHAVTLVHLGGIAVARSASVEEGAALGTIGPSGDAEHPQGYVHLGVRVADDPNGYLDPLAFLPRREAAPPPAADPTHDPQASKEAAPAPAPVTATAPAPEAEAPATPLDPPAAPAEPAVVPAAAEPSEPAGRPAAPAVPAPAVGDDRHPFRPFALDPWRRPPCRGWRRGSPGAVPLRPCRRAPRGVWPSSRRSRSEAVSGRRTWARREPLVGNLSKSVLRSRSERQRSRARSPRSSCSRLRWRGYDGYDAVSSATHVLQTPRPRCSATPRVVPQKTHVVVGRLSMIV